jgi:tRNA U34 5-methylaminomethyl-2-thiouridine-forming methyltransferase MnmC
MHKLDHIERKEKESSFNFTKSINDIQSENAIPGGQDLIFFDAFAPNTQELLWQKPVLENCFNSLNPKGILVTYCAQGQLRRDLQAVGFATERLPGPPGKREMLRATKP